MVTKGVVSLPDEVNPSRSLPRPVFPIVRGWSCTGVPGMSSLSASEEDSSVRLIVSPSAEGVDTFSGTQETG